MYSSIALMLAESSSTFGTLVCFMSCTRTRPRRTRRRHSPRPLRRAEDAAADAADHHTTSSRSQMLSRNARQRSRQVALAAAGSRISARATRWCRRHGGENEPGHDAGDEQRADRGLWPLRTSPSSRSKAESGCRARPRSDDAGGWRRKPCLTIAGRMIELIATTCRRASGHRGEQRARPSRRRDRGRGPWPTIDDANLIIRRATPPCVRVAGQDEERTRSRTSMPVNS